MKTASTSDYVLLVFLAILLGSNFMFIKIAVLEMPSELFVFLRLTLAAIVLAGVMIWAGEKMPRGPVWWALVGSAFFGYTLPFALIAWGQERVDSGVTSILMATMPLFTLVMAQIFTKDERPNRYTVAGFILALFGVVVLFGFDKLASLGEESMRQFGITLGAIAFGINAVITKKITGLPWESMTACLMVLSAIFAAPFLLFVDFSALEVSNAVWVSVIYTSLFPTALGAVLIILVVKRQGAAFLSQLNFIVPVVGAFCAVAFLGEALPPNAIAALIIILAGVALARRRPKRHIVSVNRGP